MNCHWPCLAKGCVCEGCGYALKRDYEHAPLRDCVAFQQDDEAIRQQQEKLLGDYTEDLLRSIGITPERYVGWKETIGFAPTCDCQPRKEWINKAHAWAKSKLGL